MEHIDFDYMLNQREWETLDDYLISLNFAIENKDSEFSKSSREAETALVVESETSNEDQVFSKAKINPDRFDQFETSTSST